METNQKRIKSGFTLIESLISLSLFTIFTLACLEFFSHARVIFAKLKDKFEVTESVYFTLDRIRLDLHCGGQGLLIPINLGVLDPISFASDRVSVYSSEKKIEFKEILVPGQIHIQVENIQGLKKNRLICIFDSQYGEIKTITELDSTGICLSTPLENLYLPETTTILLVRITSFYLDKPNCILRRKINASPAQPLLEDVREFKFGFDQEKNKIIFIRFYMTHEEDKFYEINFIPKNSILASKDQ